MNITRDIEVTATMDWSGKGFTNLDKEFFHISGKFEQLYYQYIELKEKYDKVQKNYENCVQQLHDRNNGDFYQKIMQGWKLEVEELKAKINELEKKALE